MHKKKWLTNCSLVAVSALLSVEAMAAQPYQQAVPFLPPGEMQANAIAIDSIGNIFGTSLSGNYVFREGIFEDFAPVGLPSDAFVRGVTDQGKVIYNSFDPGTGTSPWLSLQSGVTTPINAPGYEQFFVNSFSSDGRYFLGTGSDAALENFDLLVYDSQSETVNVIPASPETIYFNGGGVNIHGQVVGSFARLTEFGNLGARGVFTFDLATQSYAEYFDIGLAAITRPSLNDINDSGIIVGFGDGQAFVGRIGDWEVLSFPDLESPADPIAYEINNSGTIVGTLFLIDEFGAQIQRGYFASPISEVESFAMLSVGLLVLGWRLRLRAQFDR